MTVNMPNTRIETCHDCGAAVIDARDHRAWHGRLQRERTTQADALRRELRNASSRIGHILAWLEHHKIEVSINSYPEGYGMSAAELEQLNREKPEE